MIDHIDPATDEPWCDEHRPEELLGWHFLPDDGRLRFGRRKRVEVGQTLTCKRIEMCKRGYHASPRAIDALKYAPGAIVCRVRLSGRILEDTDKAVATERTCLAMADATTTLRLFACWCAEQSLKAERKAGREPDPRSWEAVKVAKRYIAGKASDIALIAALSAATSAATSFATSAATSAVRSTATSAVTSAALSAATSAALSAATSAATSAQNRKLETMLDKLLLEGDHPC